MQALHVQKYGGSSLKNSEAILQVRDRIKRASEKGHPLIVVVSAMGDQTDQLLELARSVQAEPQPRELDMLLTAGERISMSLLSMALQEKGLRAISLTGSQSGILTDTRHGAASIERILGQRIQSALDEGLVVIVAGFQGVSAQKEVTTLGRGGSDTSAVALATHFRAEKCEILSDTCGILSADPAKIKDAVPIPYIQTEMMLEFAYGGAGVLDARCMELVWETGMTLVAGSSQSETESTLIGPKPLEGPRFMGVSTEPQRTWIECELADSVPLFDLNWAQAPSMSGCRTWNTCFGGYGLRKDQAMWNTWIDQEMKKNHLKSAKIDLDEIPLVVLGSRFYSNGLSLSLVLEGLKESHVPVQHLQVSSHSVMLGIPVTAEALALQVLHKQLLALADPAP